MSPRSSTLPAVFVASALAAHLWTNSPMPGLADRVLLMICPAKLLSPIPQLRQPCQMQQKVGSGCVISLSKLCNLLLLQRRPILISHDYAIQLATRHVQQTASVLVRWPTGCRQMRTKLPALSEPNVPSKIGEKNRACKSNQGSSLKYQLQTIVRQNRNWC